MTKLDERVLASKGRWITVTFKKVDGSIRLLNGRMGVVKHLKGGQRTSNPDEYIILWDAKAKDYRNVYKSRIMSVKDQGVEYT